MKLSRRSPRSQLLLALLFCLFTCRPQALAQTTSAAPALTLTLAWEGALRIPGWTEVQVQVTGTGTPWHGELHLEDRVHQVHYRLPLSLAAHARQHYRLPLYVAQPGPFTLSLVSNATSVASQRLILRPIESAKRHCITVDPLGRLAAGPENGCEASLLLTGVEPLPETPMAWDHVDVLILHEVSTTALSAAQQEALWAWVNLGGQLVITAGPGRAQTLAGLPSALRQTLGSLTPGTRRAVGSGAVALAAPAMADTGTAWLGEWHHQRQPAISLLQQALPFEYILPTPHALMQVPQSRLPYLNLWLWLLPVYAALIGPGAWLLARRLHRPRLVWVLSPAGIGLAALGVWLLLHTINAAYFPILHDIAIIIGSDDTDAPARLMQATALFAPRSRQLSWETPLAPRPFMGYVSNATPYAYYESANHFPVTVLWNTPRQMNAATQPGPLTWAAEGLTYLPELHVALALSEGAAGAALSGSLSSAVPLRDVTLIFTDGAYRLLLANTVAANTPLRLSLPLRNLQEFDALSVPFCPILSGNYYYARTPFMPATPTAVETGSETPCYLAATMDNVPLPTRSTGATQIGESCLIISIPCPELAGQGLPLLPKIDFESSGYGWLDENGVLYVSDTLPVTLRYFPLQRSQRERPSASAQRLTLRFEAGSAAQVAHLELWHWSDRRWQAYTVPGEGTPLILEGDAVRALFDPAEGVRVRLTPAHRDMTTIQLILLLDTLP